MLNMSWRMQSYRQLFLCAVAGRRVLQCEKRERHKMQNQLIVPFVVCGHQVVRRGVDKVAQAFYCGV